MGLFGTYVHELSNDALLCEVNRRTWSEGQLDILRHIYESKERSFPAEETRLPPDFNEWSYTDKTLWLRKLSARQLDFLIDSLSDELRGKVSDEEIAKAREPRGYERTTSSLSLVKYRTAKRLLVLYGIDMGI